LTDRGVSYIDYNVAADVEKRSEMVRKSGQLGVPVIEIDGQIVVGFNRPKIEELLAA